MVFTLRTVKLCKTWPKPEVTWSEVIACAYPDFVSRAFFLTIVVVQNVSLRMTWRGSLGRVRNDTFCTITIVRKKRGEKNPGMRTPSPPVTSRHSLPVTSLPVISGNIFLRLLFLVHDVKTFHFPRTFFKPQHLKYNVWNATLLGFLVHDVIKHFIFPVLFSRTFSNRNVWNTTRTMVGFLRSFMKGGNMSHVTYFRFAAT